MGNGPRGTAPGPFPLIVILRGGAVPPNSGAVPPPLYITIRGNGPGAVPLGPFPMDKLNGPSGISIHDIGCQKYIVRVPVLLCIASLQKWRRV